MRLFQPKSCGFRHPLPSSESVVDDARQERQTGMDNPVESKCSECGGQVRRRTITQEFEKEGVKVKLSGPQVGVCIRCGEVYFESGRAQKVVPAVSSLFKLAFTERHHMGTLSARLS